MHFVLFAVFRTILKKHNLAAGDFPEIQSFAGKLNEVKFSEFSTLSQHKIDDLDQVLNVEIPKLMAVRIVCLHMVVFGLAIVCGLSLTLPCCFSVAGTSQRERLARVLAC